MTNSTHPARAKMMEDFMAGVSQGLAPWAIGYGKGSPLPTDSQGRPFSGMSRLLLEMAQQRLIRSGVAITPGEGRALTPAALARHGAQPRGGQAVDPVPVELVHIQPFFNLPQVTVIHRTSGKPIQVESIEPGDKALCTQTAHGKSFQSILNTADLEVRVASGDGISRGLSFSEAAADPSLNEVHVKSFSVLPAMAFEGLSAAPTRPAPKKQGLTPRIVEALRSLAERDGLKIEVGDPRPIAPGEQGAFYFGVVRVPSPVGQDSAASYAVEVIRQMASSLGYMADATHTPLSSRNPTEQELTVLLSVARLAKDLGVDLSAHASHLVPDPGLLLTRLRDLAHQDGDAFFRSAVLSERIGDHLQAQIHAMRVENDCRQHAVPYFYTTEQGQVHVDDFATGRNLVDPEGRRTGVTHSFTGLVHDVSSGRFALVEITPHAVTISYLKADNAQDAREESSAQAQINAAARDKFERAQRSADRLPTFDDLAPALPTVQTPSSALSFSPE